MTAAAGRDVESINEEAVEAAERALVERYHVVNDQWEHGPMTDAEWEKVKQYLSKDGVLCTTNTEVIRLALAAAVPGLERQLRDKIAGEAQSKLEAMSTANPPITGRGQAFDAGWRACCHIIARGESS